ncbi:unnamed protein product [Lactuca saligna]|uniref:Protein kinase domain-containing protein n=1 Tax=Lactuca saligna TaxID=75948 RepID=A0AA35YZI6_LACSI|nr:unnamed protein product [Lactuca saligna]
MGCIGSKHVVRSFSSPLHDSHSSTHFLGSSSSKNYDHDNNRDHPIEPSTKINKGARRRYDDRISKNKDNHVVINDPLSETSNSDSINFNFGRLTEAEHIAGAAGWPSWLSAVAGEAIHGWLPLKSDSFQRFEKIGQGTYSCVYRARHIESGKMVALKKVRFDILLPESIKFMAREITILRKLDHPNIIKLQGIITSRLSRNIYFVFEYMEHDLSGLLSCPDIKFSDSQIKCYMRQLLNGIEHCHSRGVLHRDIKTANILVNNEGILKIADFGLANFYCQRNTQSMTSHVVTLWYRPPELLLGCTKYGTCVDLWSIGCVFAELFLRKPILKARTEVEQLHKIFKLCGTPPDGYWNKSKLPFATMFKPHRNYESTLRERCKEVPKAAIDLIETLLSVEPHKRGTAKSALESEYFKTKPFACDLTSLPKYPPNKEIDAKVRKEACRKKPGGMLRASGGARNPRMVRTSSQEQTSFRKVGPTKVNPDRNNGITGGFRDTVSEYSQNTERSGESDIIPTQPTPSNGGFVWAARRQKQKQKQKQKHPATGGSTQRGGAMAVCVIYSSSADGECRSSRGFRNRRVCSGSFDISHSLPNVPVPTNDSDND